MECFCQSLFCMTLEIAHFLARNQSRFIKGCRLSSCNRAEMSNICRWVTARASTIVAYGINVIDASLKHWLSRFTCHTNRTGGEDSRSITICDNTCRGLTMWKQYYAVRKH